MTTKPGSTDSPSTSDAGNSSSTYSSTGSTSSTDSSTGSSSSAESSTGYSSSTDSSTGNSTDSSTSGSTSNYNTTAGSGPGNFWFSYSTLIDFGFIVYFSCLHTIAFFCNSFVTFPIQNLVACGTGAYYQGTLIDDDTTVSSPLECRQKCALNFDCQFWDYGPFIVGYICMLHSDEGMGPEAGDGFFYGTWNCYFEGIIRLSVSK